MKPLYCAAFLLLLTGSCQSNPPSELSADVPATLIVSQTITDFFRSLDKRDWPLARQLLASKVFLDDSSMTGHSSKLISANQVIKSCQELLLGFKQTHHQIANVRINVDSNEATAFCYTMATYYFPQDEIDNVWRVIGTYKFHLRYRHNHWQLDLIKIRLNYQDGNLDLPKRAAALLKIKSSADSSMSSIKADPLGGAKTYPFRND